MLVVLISLGIILVAIGRHSEASAVQQTTEQQ